MAKPKRANIKNITARRMKEGRGQGSGAAYRPWINTQDFPSKGRDHRKKGLLHDRQIHALSDLESNFIDIMQWASPKVVDIREQFPLDIAETIAIATELHIKHPQIQGTPVPLTTDVVVAIRVGQTVEDHPCTLKYVKDLEDPKKGRRTFEKFEIERMYWLRRDKKLLIATEREIPAIAVANITHLNAYRSIINRGVTQDQINHLTEPLTEAILHSTDRSLVEITDDMDTIYSLSPRTSLTVAQHLIAIRYWKIDIYQKFEPLRPLKLLEINYSSQ